MTLDELLDVIVDQSPYAEVVRLECRLIFRQLADNLHRIEPKLRDLSDVRQALLTMVEKLNPARGLSHDWGCTRGYARATPVCARCFHRHESPGECGVDMGGAGKCDCKAEVVA